MRSLKELANIKQVRETHYKADPSEPPMGAGGRLLSDLGVWLIVAVIAAVIVAAVIYFAPRQPATAIKPGQLQETIQLPHAERRAGGL
ncbi:MAG TPA: hypothetical protein VE309_02035 [Caulobacteraceae bacterium]|jgi:hypothetical protein|nr:hypothetical protein [Caulobacteraceae bacterium]